MGQDTYKPVEGQDKEFGKLGETDTGPAFKADSPEQAKEIAEGQLDAAAAELVGHSADEQSITAIRDEDTGVTTRFD